MAQATFVQEGGSIDYTPGSAVAAGDVVVQGDLVGVAKRPIAANELGALAVEGVFDFAKGGGVAYTVGTILYWDDTGKIGVRNLRQKETICFGGNGGVLALILWCDVCGSGAGRSVPWATASKFLQQVFVILLPRCVSLTVTGHSAVTRFAALQTVKMAAACVSLLTGRGRALHPVRHKTVFDFLA